MIIAICATVFLFNDYPTAFKITKYVLAGIGLFAVSKMTVLYNKILTARVIAAAEEHGISRTMVSCRNIVPSMQTCDEVVRMTVVCCLNTHFNEHS